MTPLKSDESTLVAEGKKKINLSNRKDLFDLVFYAKDANTLKVPITNYISSIIDKSTVKAKYKIVFLYDPEYSIRDYTANQIYQSIASNPKDKDILLILVSNGGIIEPAYLISKILKEYSRKLVVAIPRKAKSAATLLSLGADEIHMGIMSELGPIDPQISGLPALGLGNAVEYLASLCKKYPDASNMLASYLGMKLKLQELGYFQRVSESAKHYAEQLLEKKKFPENSSASVVADRLVNHYKDHGFVIDKDEASKYLGDTVKTDTEELKLSDQLYKFLEDIQLILNVVKKQNISIIGSLEEGINFFNIESKK